MGSQNGAAVLHILSKCSKYKVPSGKYKRKAPKTSVFEALIFGTPKGNGRVSNLPPGKSHLPPGETFPVSPVANLPRTPQIYSNGTRWYFIFQSPVQANLCRQAILRCPKK